MVPGPDAEQRRLTAERPRKSTTICILVRAENEGWLQAPKQPIRPAPLAQQRASRAPEELLLVLCAPPLLPARCPPLFWCRDLNASRSLPQLGSSRGRQVGKAAFLWAAGKHSATELTCWWMLPCKIHGCPVHKTLAAMHRDYINLLNSRNLKLGALLSCNGEIMVLAASACKEKKKQNTKNTHQTRTIDLTSS